MPDSKSTAVMRTWIGKYTDQIARGIDVEWATTQLEDWTTMLNDQLARETAALAANPLQKPAPKAPAAAPAQGAPATEPAEGGKSARQVEYDGLLWQARLAGKDDAEAARLATNEIARRHGEAVDPANLSLAELEASLKGMDPSVMGAPTFREDGEPLTDADLAALAESMQGPKPLGVDMARSAALTAERDADAQAASAREAAVKASMQANPHMTREQIERVIAPVEAFRVAPVVAKPEDNPLAKFTPADLGL